jgi:hypothetical protein
MGTWHFNGKELPEAIRLIIALEKELYKIINDEEIFFLLTSSKQRIYSIIHEVIDEEGKNYYPPNIIKTLIKMDKSLVPDCTKFKKDKLPIAYKITEKYFNKIQNIIGDDTVYDGFELVKDRISELMAK